MMLRARATRRFEVIAAHHDLENVMQMLAETGAVELEAKPLDGMQPVLPQLGGFLDEFAALEKEYRPYWPKLELARPVSNEEPSVRMRRILGCLRLWDQRAGPLVEALQRLEAEAGELQLLQDLVETAGGYPFAGLPVRGVGILKRAIFHAKADVEVDLARYDVLAVEYPGQFGRFFAAIGEANDMDAFRDEMAAIRAKELHVPATLFQFDEPGAVHDSLAAALSANTKAQDTARNRIHRISKKLGMGKLLAQVALFRWLFQNRDHLQGSDWTVRITGWIDPDQVSQVEAALEASEADSVLSLATDDNEHGAPMVLSNPAWLKPFEFFPRLLGIPGQGEADPSLAVALIAPLMFGFMFGDIGQGAVLLAVGLWGRRQYPLLALLIPGGIMAIVFGLLYGSVFGREDILPALWLHPLHEPMTVLGVALAMGILFLLAGVLLDAVQSLWVGRFPAWMLANGGIVLAYLSVLATFAHAIAIWGVALGLGLAIAGARNPDGKFDAGAALGALGEFLESLMRLLVSSVSFSRVGAFALAHAGLSAAIVGMADAAGAAVGLVILVLGNILIIALEGLVTGIQITRLMLFEFFTRFFKASGREFHPLRFQGADLNPRNGDAT